MIHFILTNDGSYTLYNDAVGEHYHSTHGAITESRYVFIQAGLELIAKRQHTIAVLEVGLGSGLNALLTLQYALQRPLTISYNALELYPIEAATAQGLQLPKATGAPELEEIFNQMHTAPAEKEISLHPLFTFTKHLVDVREFETPARFDLVYYDAFSPAVQPELWTYAIFDKLFHMLNPGAALVTYCARGQLKRDLKSAGFTVEKLPGAPGKRQMMRAVKV